MTAEKNRWDLPKQRILTLPGDARVGDCWRCCIAALLNVPAEKVPHFVELEQQGQGLADVLAQNWLNERGWCLISAPKFIFFHKHAGNFDGLPFIACGPTERSRGFGKHHAVVMRGNELLYDPHPSEAGLTAITECYLIVNEKFP